MKRFLSLAASLSLAGLALPLVSGCATQQLKFSSDQNPSVNLVGLKTYDWAAGKQTPAQNPPVDVAYLDPRIRAAVDRALVAKGFARTPRTEASFLVSYHVAETNVQQIEVTGHTQGDNPYNANFDTGWRPGDVEVYRTMTHMGTLTLRMTDPKTGKLLWHGSATTTLHRGENDQQKETLIQQAVTGILQLFPAP